MLDVINDTDDFFLKYQTTSEMNRLFLMTSSQSGSPTYYNFNGVDNNGDTQVDLYPIPNGVYNIRFNIIKPQVALSSDTDKLLVPNEPVIFNACARAFAERGEDGGIASGEMYALYNQSLADAIAIESSRYLEEGEWMAY
jgi:phospholipase C